MARANFSTDRICDVQLLADALNARAPRSPAGDRISLAVITGRRALQLTLGPLAAGDARVVVEQSEVEGLGSVIEKLSEAGLQRAVLLGFSDGCDGRFPLGQILVCRLAPCLPLTLPRFAWVPPSPRGRGERVGVRGRHGRRIRSRCDLLRLLAQRVFLDLAG